MADQICRDYDNSMELNAFRRTTRESAEACRQCFGEFLAKTQKYHDSLQAGQSGDKIKDFAWKLRWQVFEKDGLAGFQAKINTRCASIT